MVEVVNRQRRVVLDVGAWREFADKCLAAIGVDAETGATVAFVSDRRMRQLNREFRGRDKTTDVLSFPSGQESWEETDGKTLGDVVVSVDRAREQAVEHGLDFKREVAQLILHGLLHLCGHDHETDDGEMNRLELTLRRRLGI